MPLGKVVYKGMNMAILEELEDEKYDMMIADMESLKNLLSLDDSESIDLFDLGDSSFSYRMSFFLFKESYLRNVNSIIIREGTDYF